jgi:hypothetical protein
MPAFSDAAAAGLGLAQVARKSQFPSPSFPARVEQ